MATIFNVCVKQTQNTKINLCDQADYNILGITHINMYY